MTDDLVQRLRSNRPIPTLPHEAADRIEALIAENQQLRHDLERQMTIANEQVNEVERLRDALAHIAFSGADGPYGEFGEALNEHQMRRVAKAALQDQSK
jgi:hypothetical protein